MKFMRFLIHEINENFLLRTFAFISKHQILESVWKIVENLYHRVMLDALD